MSRYCHLEERFVSAVRTISNWSSNPTHRPGITGHDFIRRQQQGPFGFELGDDQHAIKGIFVNRRQMHGGHGVLADNGELPSTPKASVISASPMRSKSAETSISPRRKPRRRAWPDSGLSTATTLAMGRPALAMMNGSPRADLLEQLREPGLGFMNIDGFHERFARLAGLTKLGLLSSSQASSHRYRTPQPCGQSGTPARIRRCRFCLTVQQKQQHMLIKRKHNANFLAAIHEIRKL